jgi:hypothetical protein
MDKGDYHILIFMLLPHSFGHCSFVVSFDVRKCESSKFVLCFQDSFSYVGSLKFYINLISFSISRILLGSAMNL